MTTYQQIRDDIKNRHDRSVKSCWIAHVKELNGLPVKKAHNRALENERKIPCPADMRPVIEASMRRLGMLK